MVCVSLARRVTGISRVSATGIRPVGAAASYGAGDGAECWALLEADTPGLSLEPLDTLDKSRALTRVRLTRVAVPTDRVVSVPAGLVRDLAAEGLAVLFVSSEIEEVLDVCDRILVIHEGEITGEYDHDAIDLSTLMARTMNA